MGGSNGVGPEPTANACHSDGFGTGLRALLSHDDGKSFDFNTDYMVLAAGDDDNNPLLGRVGCACGYGATIQLSDGTLGTPYCYTNVTWAQECHAKGGGCFPTNLGYIRWNPPP